MIENSKKSEEELLTDAVKHEIIVLIVMLAIIAGARIVNSIL